AGGARSGEAPACDEVIRRRDCKGGEMWRGLFKSAGDRGGRGTDGRHTAAAIAVPGAEGEATVTERPAGPGAPVADVSRETPQTRDAETGWPADSADTPIGAAAERAMHVLHTTHPRLPRPARRRLFTIANQKGGVRKKTTPRNPAPPPTP